METKNDYTYEMCPYCDKEVELPDTLGLYRCPSCGKWIVACSMCLHNEDCKNCPLEKTAHDLNRNEEGDEKDELIRNIKELSYKGSSSSEDKKAKGIIYFDRGDFKFNSMDVCRIEIEEEDKIRIVYFRPEETGIVADNVYWYHLSVDMLKSIRNILLRPSRNYEFKDGKVTLKINSIRGFGRTLAEAKRNAIEKIEDSLTLYGDVDTEISNILVI